MTTDTSERGLERLICTASPGVVCRAVQENLKIDYAGAG